MAGTLKNCPFDDSVGMIESQKTCRRMALRRQRLDDPATKKEVIGPAL